MAEFSSYLKLSAMARSGLTALACLTAAAAPVAASAQAVPAPPTREDLEVGQPASPAARRGLSVEGDIERGPCPLADPAFAASRVTFSTVEFTGLPGVDASVLTPAWSEFAGREQPVAVLCEVRDRAATILRDMGFLAAVQVPPQRIEPGSAARMDVLAARLVEVQLRGDAGRAERLIAAHLADLTSREWFNTHEAERQLLLLEDLPGFDVRLVLRSAGDRPGDVAGDVIVVRRPYDLVAGAQNIGTRATGREGGFLALTLNDLTGMGDRTTVSYYNTFDWKEQRIGRIAHEFALNADGLRLGASALYGESKPDFGGAPFNTKTVTAAGYLSYPFLRRHDQTISGFTGLEIVDQELAFGSTLLSRDKLRMAYARIAHELIDERSARGQGGYTAREPRWHSMVSLELRQGLSGLGASDRCKTVADCLPPNVPISNIAADPSAFVARLEGTVEMRPVPRLTLAISPMGQYSGSSLLSYQQASFGSYTIGRGFDPGVAVGDRAVGASFELRVGSPYPRGADRFAFEPFAFFDYGKAWVDDAAGGVDPDAAISAGAGVRGRWGNRVDFDLTFAVPLNNAGFLTERPDPRLLFTITTRLLPWGNL
ncbi:MAG TPA: ShlB/FhaC/HecB family hemolysin secretion/activation protein [Croceibacterium sp.]|nr:ShlB/FhaC/HecB family hemolysin secretion/activation protein [Croceibacterium sp.]